MDNLYWYLIGAIILIFLIFVVIVYISCFCRHATSEYESNKISQYPGSAKPFCLKRYREIIDV